MNYSIGFLLILFSISYSNSDKANVDYPKIIWFKGEVQDKKGKPLNNVLVRIFDRGKFLKNKELARKYRIKNKAGNYEIPVNMSEVDKAKDYVILYEKEGFVSYLCERKVKLSKNSTEKERKIGLPTVQLYPIENVAHNSSKKKIKVYKEPSLSSKRRELETDKYIVRKSRLVDSLNQTLYLKNKLVIAEGKWIEVILTPDTKHNDTVYIFYNDALSYNDAIKCYDPFIIPVKTCQLYASRDIDSAKINGENCKVNQKSGPILAKEVVYDKTINANWYNIKMGNCTGWVNDLKNGIKISTKHSCEKENDFIYDL